jgi:hypothetical protein
MKQKRFVSNEVVYFARERRADEWKGKAVNTVYGICLRRKAAPYLGILIVLIAIMKYHADYLLIVKGSA